MDRVGFKNLLMCLFFVVGGSASAQDCCVDGIYYNLDENQGTAEVTFNQEKFGNQAGSYQGDVKIPSTITFDGKSFNVAMIGREAFWNCGDLTSVTIPGSVTTIGVDAFYNCNGLTSVIISDGVTSIGVEAFANCNHLESIEIPNSVKTISGLAFENTAWYDHQADGAVYAGRVLYQYKGTMPDNTSIIIKEGTTSISDFAFSGCSGLTSVTIPGSVTSIGVEAFADCSDLTSVVIPNSVTTIGVHAFLNTAWYEHQEDGVVYAGTVLYQYKGTMPDNTSIIIKDGTTSIGENAFLGCGGLTSVTIPGSVTSIGGQAFADCGGLTSIDIPGSVNSIGTRAFEGCSGLTSINIPEGVKSISQAAFQQCSSLVSVTLPEGVTSIAKEAFMNCGNLESIKIPSSVTTIGDAAFSGCGKLSSVHTTDLSAWCKMTFVAASSNPLYYASGLFLNGDEVKDLTIPDDVTTIGKYAFYGCSSLVSVTIPENVREIEDYALYKCDNLTSIYFSDDVKLSSNSLGDWESREKIRMYVNNETPTLQELWRLGMRNNIYDKTTGEKIPYEPDISSIGSLLPDSAETGSEAQQGVHTLTGSKVSDDITILKSLPRGIYLVNGKKILVK